MRSRTSAGPLRFLRLRRRALDDEALVSGYHLFITWNKVKGAVQKDGPFLFYKSTYLPPIIFSPFRSGTSLPSR